jgi:hypothetical protein
MTANTSFSPQATLRGNYVLLTADTLHLLLPQHEVGAAEYLEGVLEASDQPGLLKLRGTENPRRFAALSEQMTLLPRCPSGRFLVAPIGDENDDLGWCWSELRTLIDVELQLQPLPAVLITSGTPVDQYVEFGGKLAYLCSARRLCAFALASRN